MHDVIKEGQTVTFLSGLMAKFFFWLVPYGREVLGESIRSLIIAGDTVNEVSQAFLSICV